MTKGPTKGTPTDKEIELAEHTMPPEMRREGPSQVNITDKMFKAIESGDLAGIKRLLVMHPGLNLRNPVLVNRTEEDGVTRAVMISPVLTARRLGNADVIDVITGEIARQDSLEARQGLFTVIETGRLADVQKYFGANKNMGFDYRHDFGTDGGGHQTPVERAKHLRKHDVAAFIENIIQERRLDGCSIKIDPSRTKIAEVPSLRADRNR